MPWDLWDPWLIGSASGRCPAVPLGGAGRGPGQRLVGGRATRLVTYGSWGHTSPPLLWRFVGAERGFWAKMWVREPQNTGRTGWAASVLVGRGDRGHWALHAAGTQRPQEMPLRFLGRGQGDPVLAGCRSLQDIGDSIRTQWSLPRIQDSPRIYGSPRAQGSVLPLDFHTMTSWTSLGVSVAEGSFPLVVMPKTPTVPALRPGSSSEPGTGTWVLPAALPAVGGSCLRDPIA